MEAEGKHYKGFISYSQRDKKFARRLHKSLEAYSLPDGTKLGRFFRDDDELGSVNDLPAKIEESIQNSEHLILLASVNSANSKWVEAEVQLFTRHSEPDQKLLGIVLNGHPNSEDPSQECFVPALRVNRQTDSNEEPVRELFAPHAKAEKFERLVTKLVSGLVDIPFDELWDRARRRRRRRLGFASAIAMAIAISLSWAAISNSTLSREKQEAENKIGNLGTETQKEAFLDFFYKELAQNPNIKNSQARESVESELKILAVQDVNGDDFEDFYILNSNASFCGSGGCAHELFVYDPGTETYQSRYSGLGDGNLEVLETESNGHLDLAVLTGQTLDNENVYKVLRYDGEMYENKLFLVCRLFVGYCDFESAVAENRDSPNEGARAASEMVFDVANPEQELSAGTSYTGLDAATLEDQSRIEESQVGSVLGIDQTGTYELVGVIPEERMAVRRKSP